MEGRGCQDLGYPSKLGVVLANTVLYCFTGYPQRVVDRLEHCF